MADCIFCKIIDGSIPSKKAYEDDKVLAFYDIAPIAPVHILIIPKVHLASAAEINEENEALAGHMIAVASKIAKEQGLSDFRLISNCGASAGQTVGHFHIHLVGGVDMTERMI